MNWTTIFFFHYWFHPRNFLWELVYEPLILFFNCVILGTWKNKWLIKGIHSWVNIRMEIVCVNRSLFPHVKIKVSTIEENFVLTHGWVAPVVSFLSMRNFELRKNFNNKQIFLLSLGCYVTSSFFVTGFFLGYVRVSLACRKVFVHSIAAKRKRWR